MKDINSLINEIEKLQICKKNINDLKEKLNNEINNYYYEIAKKDNLDYSKEVENLKTAKEFLENYPSYLKKGLKGFWKNIISTIKVLVCSFPILFIFLVLSIMGMGTSCLNFKTISSYAQASLVLSTGLSVFGNFIHPIIYNHSEKKLILKKYESIDNIDLLIEETNEKKKENDMEIELIKGKVSLNKEKINELNKKLEELNSTEEYYNSLINEEYEEIFSLIANERYLYDSVVDDSFKLTLKK